MTDTTAKIRAKGLDATGVTEDIATDMYTHKGRHYMAIVELKVEERHEKADGTKKVDLVLTQVEPAMDDDLAEHLRELTRTLYYNRGLDGHTGSTTEGQERTTADVLASGQGHRPHPFLPVDAADEHPICDVCGKAEAAAVHSTQDVLPDDEEEPDDEGGEQDPAEDDVAAGQPGEQGPVEYDVRPDAQTLSRLVHVHVQGECIKDRDGRCPQRPTIPDPFATPVSTS